MSRIAPVPAPTPAWPAMSKEERAAWLRENGKGYLSKAEQEEELRRHHGDIEMVYYAEAKKAHDAKDDEVFWQWFSLIVPPAYYLKSVKRWNGADFIRALGFDTTEADKAYGPGWLEDKLSAPQEAQQQQDEAQQQQDKALKRLLGFEAVAVKKHQQAFSAEELVNTRKVLAHVKKIAASGNAEAIIEMEKDFIQHDLERCVKADDKEMIGSLNAALLGVAAIKQQLELVDDPQKYQAIDRGYALPKNRKQGLPLDEARQSFSSHRTRLGNDIKYCLEETEKQLFRERRKALSIAEKDYIARQARTLGVELPQRAKPAQVKSGQGKLSAREAAKRDALEKAYTSLSRAEAVQAYPELADVYKLEAAVKGFADESIPNSEAQKMFLEAIRQESFNELAKGNPLPEAKQRQAPQSLQQDLDPER